jgi:hypothetical protein
MRELSLEALAREKAERGYHVKAPYRPFWKDKRRGPIKSEGWSS